MNYLDFKKKQLKKWRDELLKKHKFYLKEHELYLSWSENTGNAQQKEVYGLLAEVYNPVNMLSEEYSLYTDYKSGRFEKEAKEMLRVKVNLLKEVEEVFSVDTSSVRSVN